MPPFKTTIPDVSRNSISSPSTSWNVSSFSPTRSPASAKMDTHSFLNSSLLCFRCLCRDHYSTSLLHVSLSFPIRLQVPVLILSRTLSGTSCKICRYLLLLSPSIPLCSLRSRLIASFSNSPETFQILHCLLIILRCPSFNQTVSVSVPS